MKVFLSRQTSILIMFVCAFARPYPDALAETLILTDCRFTRTGGKRPDNRQRHGSGRNGHGANSQPVEEHRT